MAFADGMIVIRKQIKNGNDNHSTSPHLDRMFFRDEHLVSVHTHWWIKPVQPVRPSVCPPRPSALPPLRWAAPLSSVVCPRWESVLHWRSTVVCPHLAPPALTTRAERHGHEWVGKHPAEPWTTVQSSWALHALTSAPPSCGAQTHRWSRIVWLYPANWDYDFMSGLFVRFRMDISHLLFSIFEINFVQSQLENQIVWDWVLMDFEYLTVLGKLHISGHDCGERKRYLKPKTKKMFSTQTKLFYCLNLTRA